MTSEEISKEMTSEEIKKFIREKGISSNALWRKGYYEGIADGLAYSIARTKEIFDTTSQVKGEEK